MIKVTDSVLELLQTDELALESMRAGLLNFSAYADKIKPQIENLAFKSVQKGTIVVALSRIAKNAKKLTTPLKPEIKLTDLSVKSSLCALTYEKTPDMQRKISVLKPFQLSTSDLFTITEGVTEITLIALEKAKERMKKEFNAPIKSEVNDLVAITVQYDEKLANTANFQFVLLSALAAKRIQVIEIVSTFTETSFIVKKQDMEVAMKALNSYFIANA